MSKAVPPKQDVFHQVHIKTPVMEIWLNSLADIAASLRLQKNLKMVTIEQDHAFVEKSGILTVSTMVDGESVRMIVPNRMWSYSGN